MSYPYINLGDLSGMIPGPFLIEALDDNGDGAADPAVVNQVLNDASSEVDGKVGGRYATPFNIPLPATVYKAAQFFAIRALYTRRGKAEANPYKKQAEDYDAMLKEVAAGTMPLDPNVQRANPSVSVISKPALTKPAGSASV